LIRSEECSACSSADKAQQSLLPLSRNSNVGGVHYEIYGPTSGQVTSKLQLIRRQPRQKYPEFERIAGVGSRIQYRSVAGGSLRKGSRGTAGLGRALKISATIPACDAYLQEFTRETGIRVNDLPTPEDTGSKLDLAMNLRPDTKGLPIPSYNCFLPVPLA
jgi:hypothetical protein